MEGWIKLHRKMLDWEWFSDYKTLSVFIYLLLSANHSQKKWRGVVIEKGQCLTSSMKIADATGLSRQQVRTAIEHLKATNEITIQSTKQYTIVTILKYDSYQQIGDAEQPTKQPTKQPQDNQQSTNDQPSNKQEYNKERIIEDIFKETITPNGDNSKEKKFRKPTLQEVEDYCKERNNNINAEQFINFYESKGWKIGSSKMKDWKAAIRTWESKQKEKKPQTNLFDGMSEEERAYREKEERDRQALLKIYREKNKQRNE